MHRFHVLVQVRAVSEPFLAQGAGKGLDASVHGVDVTCEVDVLRKPFVARRAFELAALFVHCSNMLD